MHAGAARRLQPLWPSPAQYLGRRWSSAWLDEAYPLCYYLTVSPQGTCVETKLVA
jgi:hypothetical protein